MSLSLRTALYRHYDKESILLYVGISSSLNYRTSSHRKNSLWANQIYSITVEYFPSWHEAEIAERVAIIKERPVYNTAYSPDPFAPNKKRVRRYDPLGRPKWRTITTYPEGE